MDLLIDLLEDPLVRECADHAASLVLVADDHYREIREDAESRAREWHHSAEDHYSVLEPMGPELVGLPRGELVAEPVADGYSYGLDVDGLVVVKRRHTPPRGAAAQYRHPDVDGYELIWSFGELDEKAFHKCQGVRASQLREDGVRVVVYKGRYGNERRTAYVVAGSEARLHALSLSNSRTEPEEQYVAALDDRGWPIRIVDPRNGFVHYRRQRKRSGNVSRVLSRLGGELAQQIPRLVDAWAAGREVEGVCLLHGDGYERFPPAVLPILTSGPERAALRFEDEWQAWDPSPWFDVVDPIYFDRGVSKVVDDVGPDLWPWLLEEATQVASLRCIDRLLEKLVETRWPAGVRRREPFVIYRVNYEEGDWKATFRSAVPARAREVLEKRGALPPPHESAP